MFVSSERARRSDGVLLTCFGEVISGIATSVKYFRTSGPPNSNTRMAFMIHFMRPGTGHFVTNEYIIRLC